MSKDYYKKIIIITAGRINDSDTTNNGLFFRSIFKDWPKDRIGQIYNSGDNSDKGFFGSYYQLNNDDRYLGKYLSIIKKENNIQENKTNNEINKVTLKNRIISIVKKSLIETGIYELIFRPRMSKEMKLWIDKFKPDLVLAQGYSIAFTELPVKVKNYTKSDLVFLTTDDWPSYLYNSSKYLYKILSLPARIVIKNQFKKLISITDIPIAFGYPMKLEYSKRYNKKFYEINHCDDPNRFNSVKPIRLHDQSIYSIITIGTFNKYRWPLLSDINLCCEKLYKIGINAKVGVVSDSIESNALKHLNMMNHIEIFSDPGNDKLPSILKGADVLLLIEGFDVDFAKSIELSISTKAHLYMFSKVPIIIYGHEKTGIVNYAKKYEWASIVDKRKTDLLYESIIELHNNSFKRNQLIIKSDEISLKFHDKNKVQLEFHKLLNN